jgi:hypothetical protein
LWQRCGIRIQFGHYGMFGKHLAKVESAVKVLVVAVIVSVWA